MRKPALLAALLLVSCNLAPDGDVPSATMPAHWSWQADGQEDGQEESAATPIVRDWWKAYEDDALNQMMAEGLAANADLLIAAARVAEARAVLSVNEANQLPLLAGQGEAARIRTSEEGISSFGTGGGGQVYNNFTLSAVLSYELDLWGRLRNASESARAQLLAQEANREAVRNAIETDIAQGYFNLRAIDAQLVVTENTIRSRQENLRYQDTQYRYGAVNGLIYEQAKAELADADATLPVLTQARHMQQTALAVLLGRTPEAITLDEVARGQDIDSLPVPPTVPDELPSTLLERRPDIELAEQQVIAANAEIGVARADYFPRISLSALLGLNAIEGDRLLRSSARNWNLLATADGPILDFGRVSGNVDAAKARKEQVLQNYMQTVRLAFKEVLDVLAERNNAALRFEAESRQVDARAEALRLASLRYDAGYSNYLEVLDAQRFLFQAQLDRITARRDQLSASASLFKALGGGWQAEPAASQAEPASTPE